MAKTATTPSRLPIDKWLADAEQRRAAVAAEIGELERAGVAIISEDSELAERMNVDVDAMKLLADIEPLTSRKAPPTLPHLRLAELYRERDILDRALVIGRSRSLQANVARVAQLIAGDVGNDWRELLRQTAIAIALLHRVNRARREFRANFPMGDVASTMVLPFENYRLLGCGDEPTWDRTTSEAQRFLQEMVAAGIVTKKEIENV